MGDLKLEDINTAIRGFQEINKTARYLMIKVQVCKDPLPIELKDSIFPRLASIALEADVGVDVLGGVIN